jgi:AcrR family transcriptional regulator
MAPRRTKHDTLRQVRAEAYRAVVRSAAERVIAEHGFVGAGIEQIAKEAGVSVGTIYRAYPGKKREIYRDIQVQRGTELIGCTQGVGLAAWRRRGDVLDAILAGLAALTEYLMGHPDYLRIVLREEKAWATGPVRQSAAQTVRWNEGMGGALEAIRQGIAQGHLVDETPEVMARTSVAMQQAHLAYWLESGQGESPERVAARLQRQFLRAFCRPEVLAVRLAPLDHDVAPEPSEVRSTV